MQTARPLLLTTLLGLFFSVLLSACGLKGPLYLPEDEAPAGPEAAQSSETAKEEEKEDEKAAGEEGGES